MSSNNAAAPLRMTRRQQDAARTAQFQSKKVSLERKRREKIQSIKKIQKEVEKTQKGIADTNDKQRLNALESLLAKLDGNLQKEEEMLESYDAQLDAMDLDEDPDDTKPGENQPAEDQPREHQPEENQLGENHPGENHPGENQPEGNQPEGNQPEGNQPEGNQPEGSQPEGNQPEGNQPEGNQPEGNQPEGNQPEGNQPEGNQPEENQSRRGFTRDEKEQSQSKDSNNSQASDSNVPDLDLATGDTENYLPPTPESGVRGSQDCDELQPQTFEDCVPEAASSPMQEEHFNFSLENGICMMTAQQGKLSMNRYGPRNSAVHVWSGTPAALPVAKMTSLHGAPHKVATDTDLVTGALLWKFKIGAIRSVAWLPKKACDSMLSLLESVEDLNPSKKIDDPNYRYPFSSAVVDLIGGPSCVCVSRSDYKRLCKGGKESHARIDRKFYTVACSQVKKYREWAGADLDASWSGAARMGRDDRSLTPFYNTPQPESLTTPGQGATPPPVSTPPVSTPPVSTPPVSTPPVSTPPVSTPATSNSSSPPSQDREDTSEDVDAKTTPISEFYAAFLTYKNVDPDTPWRSLDMETYTQFIAASKIYIAELKSKKMKVFDDMSFGRALGPQYAPV